MQRYIRGQISHVISAVCQGLLSCRRHIGKREDPGDEVGNAHFLFDRVTIVTGIWYAHIDKCNHAGGVLISP